MSNTLMIQHIIYYSHIKIDKNTQRSNWVQVKENVRDLRHHSPTPPPKQNPKTNKKVL